jgi:hypothetical protein
MLNYRVSFIEEEAGMGDNGNLPVSCAHVVVQFQTIPTHVPHSGLRTICRFDNCPILVTVSGYTIMTQKTYSEIRKALHFNKCLLTQ